jgi:electron transport protein HydN
MVEVLTVDLRKCINCGACEKACAERHENGRAHLKIKDAAQSRGHRYGDFVLPISCKRCANPVCIEVCKPRAIVREGDTVYIDDRTCIGCGKCVEACPFNAIFMHEKDLKPTAPYSERSILSMLFQKEKSGRVEQKKVKVKKVRKAYKCDRCKGYENMACIEVCFYEALSLMDIDKLPRDGKPEHIALLERHVVAEYAEPQT